MAEIKTVFFDYLILQEVRQMKRQEANWVKKKSVGKRGREIEIEIEIDRQADRQTDRQIKREGERERGAGLTPANSTKKVGVSLEVSAKVATMSNGSWNTYSVPIMPSIQLLRAVVTRSGRIARRRIKRSKSESCFW